MRLYFLIALLCPVFSIAAHAQSVTVSPPQNNDGFYHPGDTITATVNAPSSCFVTLSADLHYEISPTFLLATPYTFTVTIPQGAALGTQAIEAGIKCAPANSNLETVSTQIYIEAGTIPAGATLYLSPDAVWLKYFGQSRSISVYLRESQSSMLVSQSSQLTAISSDPTIVSVSGSTLTAGNHAGTATVTFSLGTVQGKLQVTNEASGVQGDLNGDGKVDIDDVNIIEAALNTPASGPNDARDVNHDGVINALDARILTTLCTNARCATHK